MYAWAFSPCLVWLQVSQTCSSLSCYLFPSMQDLGYSEDLFRSFTAAWEVQMATSD